MKKRIGIVASSLSHSLSPTIHNYWLKKNNINAEYICFELKEIEIRDFYKDYEKDKNFLGFNITIPYKENFLSLCSNINKKTRKIGALNLIYKKNNVVYGNNTDYIGFGKIYKKLVKKKKIRKILLIGSGGAAKSILQYLNDVNIQDIDIYSRTLNKMKSLNGQFKFNNYFIDYSKIQSNSYDLVINSSSSGMMNKNFLHAELYKVVSKSPYAIDIVYNPALTKLLRVANDSGSKTVGGLNMLLEQAKPSFDCWFNTNVVITPYLKDKIRERIKNG